MISYGTVEQSFLLGKLGELLLSDLDSLSNVVLSLLVGKSLGGELLVVSLGVLVSLLLDGIGVLSDLSLDFLVKSLNGLDTSLLEGLEPSLELDGLLLGSLQLLEVVIDVAAQNSLSEDLVVSLGLFLVEAGESGGRVGDVDTSVSDSLKSSEDLRAGGGGLKSDVEDDLEGSSVLLVRRNIVVLLGSGVSSVGGIEADLFEESSGDEETNGVGGGIVGETSSEAVSSEFVRISRGEDLIALDGGVDDLGNDSGGGDSDNKSVLGGVVSVLVLDDQSLSGEVVSLSLSSSSELGLVAHEVCLVLDELNESHLW